MLRASLPCVQRVAGAAHPSNDALGGPRPSPVECVAEDAEGPTDSQALHTFTPRAMQNSNSVIRTTMAVLSPLHFTFVPRISLSHDYLVLGYVYCNFS